MVRLVESVMNYIHPESKEINEFINNVVGNETELQKICENILKWFDDNVMYSRLNAPFFHCREVIWMY